MKTVSIDIGKKFSRYPAGRFVDDGPFSGERFRDEFLVPPLRREETVEVLMDSTAGYGSSFLEEAFGGLIRVGISPRIVKAHLLIRTEDAGLETEIAGYIADEIARRGG
jgi:hypothetical protein